MLDNQYFDFFLISPVSHFTSTIIWCTSGAFSVNIPPVKLNMTVFTVCSPAMKC